MNFAHRWRWENTACKFKRGMVQVSLSRFQTISFAAGVLAWLGSVQAWAAEPLSGKWHLDRQEINGKQVNAEPLILQVTPAGDELAFKFSLPVNSIYFVSMSYTVRLDGSEADVKNAHNEKIGSIKMLRGSGSQYKLTIRGPDRPVSSGTLTVSADGKTLTSESDSGEAGRQAHVTQLFSRY